MTPRITTRGGRKIRHVTPVWLRAVTFDVAPEYYFDSVGAYWVLNQQKGWVRVEPAESRCLRAHLTAAGICALVRALVEAWQAEYFRFVTEPGAALEFASKGEG